MNIVFSDLGLGRKLRFNPFLAPALITAGAGLVSSVVGSATQSSANKSYLQGVRETNQANLDLYKLQQADARQNWSMENAYNTPAMQLARLRSAGINSSASITGQQGSSIQSVSASPQVAPEQTPNPFGNMNLGGIAKDALSAYSAAQQISDTQMSLYQHGIDSAMYYEQKVNELNGQILELSHKENLNKMDEENLFRLITERKYFETERKKHMRQLDDIHDESLRKQNLYDSQVFQIEQDIAIKRFMADTERQLAYTEAKRVRSQVTLDENQILMNWNDYAIKQAMHELEKQVKQWDIKQKEYGAAVLYHQALQAGWTSDSNFNKFMKRCFGFNINEILSGSATYKLSSDK